MNNAAQRTLSVRNGRISNAQRLRNADAAVTRSQQLALVLMAVLAQKGGEITISKGTMEQLTSDMGFEIVDSPAVEGEKIVRLVVGKPEPLTPNVQEAISPLVVHDLSVDSGEGVVDAVS